MTAGDLKLFATATTEGGQRKRVVGESACWGIGE